ncbi:hypothetical protein TNIN_430171 [Trichonephila inaurata madagascariensis]|uniref:Transposase n=1 Tax=Trichonephila inaurata madagascariensis TaxID=2747483 RepID=A0A8X7CE73_9ARAC|nr:hypothetical protein TNIN_430171 [Trichonephila inaurata madagascariensis]
MLMACFDTQRYILLKVIEPDVSINAQWCTQTLDKLHKVIKNKRQSMLSSGVIILHDNAKPNVAKMCIEVRKKWEVLEHPAYSPDLSLVAAVTSLDR